MASAGMDTRMRGYDNWEDDDCSGGPLSIFRQAQCQNRMWIENIKVFILQIFNTFLNPFKSGTRVA
jgi:hypothetical protein